MKRVILGGSMNPYNKGDQARIRATLRQLGAASDIRLAILSHNFEGDKQIYGEDDVEIVKAPWSGREINLARMAAIALLILVEYSFIALAGFVMRVPIRGTFHRYDALVIASGIDFSDFAGRWPLYYCIYLCILFGGIMRKPVMCYAQSMGPIEDGRVRRITKFFLNRMRMVSVREENSYVFLRDLRVDRPRVFSTADPAFLLSSPARDASDILVKYGIRNMRRPLVGLSLSPRPYAGPGTEYCSIGLWFSVNREKDEELSKRYLNKMAFICDHLMGIYGAALLFIPTCSARGDNDRDVMREVWGKMAHREDVTCLEDGIPLAQTMKIISVCDMFIATRLHACILAAIMGVPLLPLVGTDGPRFPGIMRMLGLDGYIRNIMTAEENQVITAINGVWNARGEIQKVLKARTAVAKTRAEENIRILCECCCAEGAASQEMDEIVVEALYVPADDGTEGLRRKQAELVRREE